MQAHQSQAAAGPSNAGTSRYLVQTSDVIQDMRVNVSDEGSGKIIWYKERFLGDDEIIENLVYNSTSTIHWTIHRPLRGWYIRIRSPTFPPGVFIPLTPVPSASPLHTDAALSLNTRTNMTSIPDFPPTDSRLSLQDRDIPKDENPAAPSSSGVHSYPPTPTAVINVLPPTPLPSTSSPGNFDSTTKPKTLRRPAVLPSSQITQFILSPMALQSAQQPETLSFFARALSVLKSQAPTHSSSFTLARVIPPNQLSSPPPPYASNVSIIPSQASAVSLTQMHKEPQPELHTPVLVFHDHTPVLTVRSLTGLIEMDRTEEACLGVDTSFWIAVALTYLEFLEERDSYLAASSD